MTEIEMDICVDETGKVETAIAHGWEVATLRTTYTKGYEETCTVRWHEDTAAMRAEYEVPRELRFDARLDALAHVRDYARRAAQAMLDFNGGRDDGELGPIFE